MPPRYGRERCVAHLLLPGLSLTAQLAWFQPHALPHTTLHLGRFSVSLLVDWLIGLLTCQAREQRDKVQRDAHRAKQHRDRLAPNATANADDGPAAALAALRSGHDVQAGGGEAALGCSLIVCFNRKLLRSPPFVFLLGCSPTTFPTPSERPLHPSSERPLSPPLSAALNAL